MFGTAQVSSTSFFTTKRESSTFSLGGHGSSPSSTGGASVANVPVSHHVAAIAASPLPGGVLVAAAGDAGLTLATVRRCEDQSHGVNPLRATGVNRLLTISAATELNLATVTAASAVTATPFAASTSRTTGSSVYSSALVVAADESGLFDVFEVNGAGAIADPALAPTANLVCSGDIGRVTSHDTAFSLGFAGSTLAPHERRVVAAASAWCASIGTAWVVLANANRLTIFDSIGLCRGECKTALSIVDADTCPSFTGSHGGATIISVSSLMRHSHRTPTAPSSSASNASSSEADDDAPSIAPGTAGGALQEAAFSVLWDDGTVHTVVAIIGDIQSGHQQVAFTAIRSVTAGVWLPEGDGVVAAAGSSIRSTRGPHRQRTVIVTPEGQLALASYSANLEHGDVDPMTWPVAALPDVKRLKATCSASKLCVVDGRATSTTDRASSATVFVVASGVDLLAATWDQSSMGGGVRPLRNIGIFINAITALATLPPLPATSLERANAKGTATPASLRSSQTNVTVGRLGTLDGPVAVAAADGALHFTML